MKKEINYTLLSDGSSDRVLIPIINWTLRQNLDGKILIQHDWANLYLAPGELNLSERMSYALVNFPCDILFIHRDSEASGQKIFRSRKQEIENGWINASKNNQRYVPIVPIRMTEAWLLIDELAIRKASGNPNGILELHLPIIRNLETLSNPKNILERLIYDASELNGRSRKKFNINKAKHLVTENISDFSLLRSLKSFQYFENDLKNVLTELDVN